MSSPKKKAGARTPASLPERTAPLRKAMEGYLRDRLGLTMTDGKMPVRLLEIR